MTSTTDQAARKPRAEDVASPDAIIASTLKLEPFLAGGEAQLEGALQAIADRGSRRC